MVVQKSPIAERVHNCYGPHSIEVGVGCAWGGARAPAACCKQKQLEKRWSLHKKKYLHDYYYTQYYYMYYLYYYHHHWTDIGSTFGIVILSSFFQSENSLNK